MVVYKRFFIIVCPKCKHQQKCLIYSYYPINHKRKCVYCGYSFTIHKDIKNSNIIKEL